MTGESFSSSTHPPLPPTTEDIQLSHLRLLRSRRVGPSTYHRLLIEHGTAQKALAALPEVARAAGVKDYEICPHPVVAAELKAGHKIGAKLLIHGHSGYPQALMELYDAPPILWALGNTDLLHRPMISIVGARNASALGTRMSRGLARELGKLGYIIVSGLARGIDAAAHAATLETGTIAVMGGGVDVIYPAENADLSEKIAQNGLRLSEQPIGLQPMARHFPARNRIIAGLGQACVVVEAAAKSGSLITAKDAADLGRDVLAVPGHPFDARSAGCNILIREGAILVRRAEDVVEALAPLASTSPTSAGSEKILAGDPVQSELPLKTTQPDQDMTQLHQKILDRLGPVPMPEDQLLRELSATASTVTPALTDLELDGLITRHSGGMLSRSC